MLTTTWLDIAASIIQPDVVLSNQLSYPHMLLLTSPSPITLNVHVSHNTTAPVTDISLSRCLPVHRHPHPEILPVGAVRSIPPEVDAKNPTGKNHHPVSTSTYLDYWWIFQP